MVSGKFRKPLVALAVGQETTEVEHEVSHDGREEEKEGREDDSGPAEATSIAFFGIECVCSFIVRRERRIVIVERKNASGVEFARSGGGVETGLGNGSFRNWSIPERIGFRMAEVREGRIGRVTRESGRRYRAEIRKDRGLVSRGEFRFSWKSVRGEGGRGEGGSEIREGTRMCRGIYK